MSEQRKILIFDTTLRDGEQSPGCSMSLHEKVSFARQLERLGVDIIEAGFPASSDEDFEAVRAVAGEIKNARVVAFARAISGDIERAIAAVKNAASGGVNVCIATSPIHMEKKLKMTPQQVLERIDGSVRQVKAAGLYAQFSAEDAIRSEPEFLVTALKTAIAAGADAVNVPDTVGYTTAHEIYSLFKYLRENIDFTNTVLAVHCHNDLGMAAANSLAAVEGGATQIECTVNGIGERAGNAALEELAVALYTRADHFCAVTGIDLGRIYRTSRTLASMIGRQIPPNKPIVGANAFAHEAGIHQHGVLTERSTYEIISPKTVGIVENQMVLGKHSGRHGFEERLAQLGVHLEPEEVEAAFEQFKALAERKNEISDRDLETIIGAQLFKVKETVQLVRFIVNSGNTIPGMATVKLLLGSTEIEDTASGDGPIDAAFKTISRIVGKDYRLADFTIHSVGEGEDAQGEVTVRVVVGGELYIGRGISTDIIEASLLAYINAINKSLKE